MSTTYERKPIPGWEPYYEADTNGDIWSWHPKHLPDGRKIPKFGGTKLRPTKHKFGYPYVTLSKPGCVKKITCHRLIALTFHGPAPRGCRVVRHRDGDPADNRPHMLAWGTYKENAADAVLHKRTPRGERHKQAKMTDSAVIEARSRYAAGDTLKTLCAVYKISPSAMFSIVQGLAWTHIGGPIAPPPRIMGRVPKERIPEVLETYEAGVSAMNIGKKFGVSSTAIRSIILKHTKEGMRPVIKLTIQDVIDIRRACHTGQSVAALAKHYAVTEENVSMIVRGKTWAHVDAGVPLAPTNTHGRRTLTDKQAILIRQRYDAGEGSTSIARDFPVTRTAINLIGQRRTYNNG